MINMKLFSLRASSLLALNLLALSLLSFSPLTLADTAAGLHVVGLGMQGNGTQVWIQTDVSAQGCSSFYFHISQGETGMLMALSIATTAMAKNKTVRIDFNHASTSPVPCLADSIFIVQ
ncbi:exported hypothetical protein [Gammaproteobacteria bacterium]